MEAFAVRSTISMLAYCVSQLIYSGQLIRIGSDETVARASVGM